MFTLLLGVNGWFSFCISPILFLPWCLESCKSVAFTAFLLYAHIYDSRKNEPMVLILSLSFLRKVYSSSCTLALSLWLTSSKWSRCYCIFLYCSLLNYSYSWTILKSSNFCYYFISILYVCLQVLGQQPILLFKVSNFSISLLELLVQVNRWALRLHCRGFWL